MENDKIKTIIESYTESPRPQIWDRIEHSLNQETEVTPLYKKRWLIYSIAASFVLFLGTIFVFQNYFGPKQANLFSYNIHQKPVQLEEINVDDNTNTMYSLKNIVALSEVYKNKGKTNGFD